MLRLPRIPSTRHLARAISQRRCFQTRADYESWTQRMKASRLLVSDPQALKRVDTREAAPFLYSVSPISDRLLLFASAFDSAASTGANHGDAGGTASVGTRSPFSSMLECVYPLESGCTHRGEHVTREDLELIRSSVSDFGSWSMFRLSKFYSDVDALTADVAYRHVRGSPDAHHISFVTAGHFSSRKMRKADLSKDLIIRCYPTSVGRSSIEIRTDAVQMKDEEGGSVEKLVNVCFTSMVAVDSNTLRPIKDVIPDLTSSVDTYLEGFDEHMQRAVLRAQMADEHNTMRKQRRAISMQLRGPPSSPPTNDEMSTIHQIHQIEVNNTINENDARQESHLPRVSEYTFKSHVVVYPERRNVHGKLFGGFAMEQGHILAQYAADWFNNHYSENKCHASAARAIPLGLDEATFLQPVSIGDHVTFIARVVHSTRRTCRVVVTVEVRDPCDRDSIPKRSNRMTFLFGGEDFPDKILPNTYREILMQVDAQRRSLVEGPMDAEVDQILHGDAK
eukprot:scaffold18841_cov83-Cyclotella_meneghiniana.AAC.10